MYWTRRAQRIHRDEKRYLVSRLRSVEDREARLIERHSTTVEALASQTASAEAELKVEREHSAGLEKLCSTEAARIRELSVEAANLRTIVRDMRDVDAKQRLEMGRLEAESNVTLAALDRVSLKLEEQVWRFESTRIGFRTKRVVHAILDSIQAVIPAVLRRAVRGVYLPAYQRLFPDGAAQRSRTRAAETVQDVELPRPAKLPSDSAGTTRSIEIPSISRLPDTHRPLVSVVMPVWNHAELVGDAVLGVLTQTYGNTELIIVDDGSTDDLTAALAPFATDRRVVVVRREHRGIPQALNAGFLLATGELWTWTSADNLMHPEMIETLVGFLRCHPDVDMTFGNIDLINETGRKLEGSDRWVSLQNPESTNELRLPKSVAALGLTDDNFIGACFLYTATLARVVGHYEESLIGVEDFDYWLRVAEVGTIEHVGIDRPLYHYRVHPNSLTARRPTEIREAGAALVRRHRDRVRDYRRPLSVALVIDDSDAAPSETVSQLKDCLRWDGHQVVEISLSGKVGSASVDSVTRDWRASLDPESWGLLVCFTSLEYCREAVRGVARTSTIVACFARSEELAATDGSGADWILTDTADSHARIPQAKRLDWSQFSPGTLSGEFELPLCLRARDGQYWIEERTGNSSPVLVYLGPTEESAVNWSALERSLLATRSATLLIVSTDMHDGVPESLLRHQRVRYAGYKPIAERYRYLSVADVLLAPFTSSPDQRAAFHDTCQAYLCAAKPIAATDVVRSLGFHDAPSVWMSDARQFGRVCRTLMDMNVDVEAVDRYRMTRSMRRAAQRLVAAARVRLEAGTKSR